ncbi:hypothetical protein H2203_001930 [Taxawa tesnikishii (nom. ined.)]|nr:hypothetical protein H2203_001930 [Dothideales sp. JES 119]
MAPHHASEEERSSSEPEEDSSVDESEYESYSLLSSEPGSEAEDESGSEPEMQLIADGQLSKKEEKILHAYHKLSSRRVDLIGDYAGNELFLIEGDSMLLHCFSDSHLDFGHGFQVLHAVYLVENFLHHLDQRKCNFHITFFDHHRALCVPHGVSEQNVPKYLLARAAIIRHLMAHMHGSTTRVRRFESVTCDSFQQYLAQTGLYFMMCHDGARPSHGPQDDHRNHAELKHMLSLRTMILSFINRGYNVALVNGLEWRDTKVFTMVLERSRRTPHVSVRKSTIATSTPKTQRPEWLAAHKSAISALSEQHTFSEREYLAVATISQLLVEQDQHSLSREQLRRAAVSFLLHIVLLKQLAVSARRFGQAQLAAHDGRFLSHFAITAERILSGEDWNAVLSEQPLLCDLCDLVDGRLYAVITSDVGELPCEIRERLETLCQMTSEISGENLSSDIYHSTGNQASSTVQEDAEEANVAVMPFSNSVFDTHLKSIHLTIDKTADDDQSSSSARIFREISHWHNAKRPIVQKGIAPSVSAKEEFWALRRNQWFMAEMRTYAASLTNAVGKSLEPETIVVGAARPAAPTISSSRDSPASGNDADTKRSKGKGAPEPKKKAGKIAAKIADKQARQEGIAAAYAKKEEAGSAKLIQAWHVTSKNILVEQKLSLRYGMLKDYLTSLPKERSGLLAAEVQLCMLSTLLEHWIQICRSEGTKDPGVGALIWHTARNVLASSGLTKTVCEKVDLTLKTLALPGVPIEQPAQDRALPFKFALPTAAKCSLTIDIPVKDFQLLHCGPYLDRSIDSAPDPRVDFEPDGWQRRVLDGIDTNKSLFVVAPTSAGKTFISFYAMRKVLEADDDGVLVYVAPTKALVNQIAAEIQARYSKKFKYPGKSVWAIHTRDYRINNPTGCQVLVTVPHVLQIMLLAPSHANSWSNRVKRIIFDEVHSIGNAEDGVVWEQLLLLAPCPIIALSATVGNPAEFSDWLSNTQAAIGNEVVVEGTKQRYSDLRKFNYVPPKSFVFNGLGDKAGFSKLGLDGTPGFAFIHPIATLVNKSRGMPDDLGLEPRDCFSLWAAMVKHQTKAYPVPADLDPRKQALPRLVGKKDTISWEQCLKDVLRAWMADDKSPFDAVLADLGQSFHGEKRQAIQYSPPAPSSGKPTSKADTVVADDLLKTTLPLLCSLHEQDALPAILFNYERGLCERICQAVIQQLQEAESAWKESSPKWKAKLKAWDEWKKVQEKLAAKKGKTAKSSNKKMSKDDREEAESDRTSRLDQQRESGGGEYSEFERFDPDAPADGFHFADHKKLLASELDNYLRQLGRRRIPQWLIDAVSRGIGVHHAGMNRKYRQVVEILFRKGFLRVVIATGTLALGINMPCKTVVFSGDSVFLTALNFRQGAGRAGRRGFDLLGNVVFQDISEAKICRLLSSRLPDLNGHFPVTTTLVLRLFSLLHESKNSPYAVKSINSLLSQPRLYMGGPAFKDQTLHHLRFSIEYLRRQYLLDSKGATLNFAGLVSHLYFTENASFAFHALLKEGYFHRLCADIDKQEKSTVETLMLVMAHLFGRVYCRQADEEYRETVVKPSSSIVFLPSLPADASRVLREHAEDTLQIFRTYVQTFADQHVQHPDNQLPLTKMEIGAAPHQNKKLQADPDSSDNNSADVANDWEAEDDDEETEAGIKIPALEKMALPPTKIRSQFVGLSGHSDTFSSIVDLCRTARSGVFLEESVIPHVGSYPDELDSPLNAYLLDFFKHGDINTLERANRIRKGDVWFLLNDFTLILATIITSLMNFMKLKPSNDLDMLDVMGNLDSLEEAEDDKVAASETEATAQPVVADPVKQPERPVINKKKGKNMDSWEDAEDDEEARLAIRSKRAARAEADDLADAAWEGQGGEKGLLNVLKAFQKLHKEFNEKFRAMWA